MIYFSPGTAKFRRIQ